MDKRTYPKCEILQDKVDKLVDLIEYINGFAVKEPNGLPPFNNTELWANVFHSLSNDDWWDLIDVIDAINEHPEHWMEESEAKAILVAVDILRTSDKLRCLDTKNNKFHEWKAMMNMRDLINRIRGWKRPKTKYQPLRNNFNNVFELRKSA